VIGGGLRDHSPESAYNASKRGKINTRLGLNVTYKDETAERGGRSVYFGSPKSDQRVIVYDKAVEQKRLFEAWTRVEMRLKGDYAKTLAEDMQASGVTRAGDSKLKKLWDADIEWFQNALSKDLIEPGEVPNKETNFPRWLNGTVLPGIEKRLETDRETIMLFHRAVGRLLKG